MTEDAKPQFKGGRNIAMKTPPHLFKPTVAFYKDVLGLTVLSESESNYVFEFGEGRLWIDLIPNYTHAEVWLEVTTDDTAKAAEYLAAHGVTRRDEAEPLPADVDGFWICNPANIIHLMVHSSQS